MITSLPCWALKIKVHRTAGPVAGNLPGQRGFADLTRPQQHHGGRLEQFLADDGFSLAGNNCCNFNVKS
jgi:hypothetical protein